VTDNKNKKKDPKDHNVDVWSYAYLRIIRQSLSVAEWRYRPVTEWLVPRASW